MALTKPMDFGNGVITKAAYISIASISINYEAKTASFMVKTFLNKETKEKGLLPISNPEHFSVGDMTNRPYPGAPTPWTPAPIELLANESVPEPVVTEPVVSDFDKYFLSGDAEKNACNYLLSLPNFKGCTVVI